MNLQYVEKANLQHPWEVLKISADSANIQVIVAPHGLKMKHSEKPLTATVYISMNGTAAMDLNGLKGMVKEIEAAIEKLSDTKALQKQELMKRIESARRSSAEAEALRLKALRKIEAAEAELVALEKRA